ncbi:Txe/YoeB family addiction module toxin [Coraliomargarita sinensis]|uniref:Putative mRNA interferase YoeB n=1 Tax=Coraliomargarita sinensis TaxID=2174842 RepID=A0A317ZH00_9BACT|nr:Txe/YoeB family addiction module toxin [Coraliomargarita sinensis]PXA03059.1 Txe/YoeB family addiction module toxin [Coraliomargarita sinensis]
MSTNNLFRTDFKKSHPVDVDNPVNPPENYYTISVALRLKINWTTEPSGRDPFRQPPDYEALVGDLSGTYSRRTNIQHRLVYQVYEEEKAVKVLRMWTHYGD